MLVVDIDKSKKNYLKKLLEWAEKQPKDDILGAHHVIEGHA